MQTNRLLALGIFSLLIMSSLVYADPIENEGVAIDNGVISTDAHEAKVYTPSTSQSSSGGGYGYEIQYKKVDIGPCIMKLQSSVQFYLMFGDYKSAIMEYLNPKYNQCAHVSWETNKQVLTELVSRS